MRKSHVRVVDSGHDCHCHRRSLSAEFHQDSARLRARGHFRLGPRSAPPKGPGIIFVFRPIDQMVRITLRQEVLEVPPQDVITRDNVTIKVNAVVTLYVVNPNDAAIKVANYVYQTSQFAQTTLRSVLGEVELDELLSHRDKLNLAHSDDHRSAHGAVRGEGDFGGSEAGGPA